MESAGAAAGTGSAASVGSVTCSRRSSAAAAASRGPIGRVRPGSDSLLRMRLDLSECATGVTKQVTVDTAILCDLCHGRGTHGDSTPVTCDTCGGHGEVQTVQRSLLGQVHDVAAVSGVRRRRRGHPRPVPPLWRRRPGARPPRGQRQDPRRRRRRHARAAGRPGRGRPRRRTRRRPVRRGPRTTARRLHPRRRRPALHHLGADGRRRARHHGHRRRDHRRSHRDHHRGGHPAGIGRVAAWARHAAPALRRARQPARPHRGRGAVAARPRRTPSCCASSRSTASGTSPR